MKCKKLLNNNVQCQAFAQHGKDYCFRHDPTQSDHAAQSSRKGGENRGLRGIYGKSVHLESPDDLRIFLGKVINAIWTEGVPVQVGSSMGFLARCWLDAYEASNIPKKGESLRINLDKYLS